jgi:hypothetical protein
MTELCTIFLVSLYCRRSVSVQGGRERAVVALSQSYSFTVRDKVLTGPPSSFQRGRRRSSSFLQFLGKRVSQLVDGTV